MTPMHPHWQSTEEEQIVPVRDASAPQAPARNVSRAPAAIVGILLMLGVAAFSFGGLEALIGQVTNPTPDVTIRILQSGPEPATVDIRPGQTIRWINEDQIPHVLTSETLPTQDGKPFSSTAIFTNSDYFYTVPLAAIDGTHEYISETSPELAGEIVITTAVAVASSSSAPVVVPAPIVSSSSSSIAPLPLPVSSAAPQPLPIEQISSASVTPLPANVIAVNPHVVGTRPTGGSSASRKTVVTDHKPTKHTESGPEVWIVLGCSVIALAIATKGAFRKV